MNNNYEHKTDRELIELLAKKINNQEEVITDLKNTIKELILYLGKFNEPLNKVTESLDIESSDGIHKRVKDIDGKFNELNYRLTEMVSRNTATHQKLDDITVSIRRLHGRVDDLSSRVDKLHEKLDRN